MTPPGDRRGGDFKDLHGRMGIIRDYLADDPPDVAKLVDIYPVVARQLQTELGLQVARTWNRAFRQSFALLDAFAELETSDFVEYERGRGESTSVARQIYASLVANLNRVSQP